MKVKYCPRCQMDLRGGHLEDCSYVVTERQEAHKKSLADEAFGLVRDKYEKGAREHSTTDLSSDYTVPELVEMALEEAVDQLIYLMELRRRLSGTCD